MLINPSLYNFLEKNIFDFQITIDRVHPVQISSCSDHCIPTDIMCKHTKNAEKTTVSLKNMGLVSTMQQEPDFLRTCSLPVECGLCQFCTLKMP